MPATDSAPLAGCYVISLRPRGGHAALRRAAAARGARLLALSPWRIEALEGRDVRARLASALAAPHVVFSSPAAVAAARALAVLGSDDGQAWYGLGAGTLRALRRAGVATAQAPSRMDSEGLLALPGLQDVRGCVVGLVTAPGGRGVLAATLLARGARLARADVYARVAVAPTARTIQRLQSLDGPGLLALSSGEALDGVLAGLPPGARARLRQAHVFAASDRLAALATDRGFGVVSRAGDARPAALVQAMAEARVRTAGRGH